MERKNTARWGEATSPPYRSTRCGEQARQEGPSGLARHRRGAAEHLSCSGVPFICHTATINFP
jgi:hypothetical protein